MTEGEAWEQIESLGILSKVVHEIYHNKELSQVFPRLVTALGIPLKDGNCINCYGDSLALVKAMHKKIHNPPIMIDYSSNLYEPKKQFPIGIPKPVNDWEAREMLKEKPSFIKWFERYPENWQEDILRNPETVEEALAGQLPTADTTPPQAPTIQNYNKGIEEIITNVEPEPIPEVFEKPVEPTEPQTDGKGLQEIGGGTDAPSPIKEEKKSPDVGIS